MTFADEGVDVSTVADAESAMLRFVEIQPDIVLVDVGLSGTNGYHICEMIKADEATNHIPVLLLVGSFEPFDQDEAERVNADGYLTKPFHSIRDLVARVWDLLGGKSDALPLVEELPPIPTFGDAFTDKIPLTDDPESDDIEDLYRSSFAETATIEELDTVEDMFGDDVMDDEMIETSRVSPPENCFADISNTDTTNGEVKEFDWSPESIVDGLQRDPATPPSSKPKFFLEETDATATGQADDSLELNTDNDEEEKLWLAETARGPESVNEDRVADLETIEISNTPDLVGAFSFSPPSVGKTEPDDESDILDPLDFTSYEANQEAVISESVDPAIHDTIPYEPGDQPPVADVEPEPEHFSPELIERIAQRVIERLSDSVVREVAKEEVPRIAEKLIREALEQQNKG